MRQDNRCPIPPSHRRLMVMGFGPKWTLFKRLGLPGPAPGTSVGDHRTRQMVVATGGQGLLDRASTFPGRVFGPEQTRSAKRRPLSWTNRDIPQYWIDEIRTANIA